MRHLTLLRRIARIFTAKFAENALHPSTTRLAELYLGPREIADAPGYGAAFAREIDGENVVFGVCFAARSSAGNPDTGCVEIY